MPCVRPPGGGRGAALAYRARDASRRGSERGDPRRRRQISSSARRRAGSSASRRPRRARVRTRPPALLDHDGSPRHGLDIHVRVLLPGVAARRRPWTPPPRRRAAPASRVRRGVRRAPQPPRAALQRAREASGRTTARRFGAGTGRGPLPTRPRGRASPRGRPRTAPTASAALPPVARDAPAGDARRRRLLPRNLRGPAGRLQVRPALALRRRLAARAPPRRRREPRARHRPDLRPRPRPRPGHASPPRPPDGRGSRSRVPLALRERRPLPARWLVSVPSNRRGSSADVSPSASPMQSPSASPMQSRCSRRCGRRVARTRSTRALDRR